MLRSLSSSFFRNLDVDPIRLDPGVTLVCGMNGQGKTNLLESIAVLGNLRSFRHASVRKMVAHHASSFRLEGVVESPRETFRLRQVVEIGPPVRRTLEINGVRAPLERYLAVLPVFVLSRGDTDLVEGAPENRRSMIDRMAFFEDQQHLADLRQYKTCLRQRNAALTGGVSDKEMEIWESKTADAASRVVCRRRKTINVWKKRFLKCYEELRGNGFPDIEAEYRGETWLNDRIDKEVAEKYRERYYKTRVRDRLAGYTLEGPHRHDLLLKTGGRSVRDVLSAGQVKTAAAALCIATLAEVEEKKNEILPVLVDDADAEIDEHVLSHLVGVLGQKRQVVMSSAHEGVLKEIVPTGTIFVMVNGRATKREAPQEDVL